MKQTLYQLIFLGDTSCKAYCHICKRFFELLGERGFDASLITLLNADTVLLDCSRGGYDSAKPSFAFYLGGHECDEKDIQAIKKLKDNADPIYPIYFTKDHFKYEIPELLHSINGSIYDDSNLDFIVNVALEELRLLRKMRRVFVSYKRSDSVAVANQLFDVLSRCQFDVFMDAYSIRGASEFQMELKHRITDSDVLIQLNSPHFMDSQWCREEISTANSLQIGVLQINWPFISSGERNMLSSSISLSNKDFTCDSFNGAESTLEVKILKEIASKVEYVRARNMASRQDALTAEFVKEANRQGRTVIKAPTFLVEEHSSGHIWYYIPAIGVPQSIDFQNSQDLLSEWKIDNPEKVFLIYDDFSVLPQWIKHFDWISNYLEIKAIKKQDFALWLEKTK